MSSDTKAIMPEDGESFEDIRSNNTAIITSDATTILNNDATITTVTATPATANKEIYNSPSVPTIKHTHLKITEHPLSDPEPSQSFYKAGASSASSLVVTEDANSMQGHETSEIILVSTSLSSGTTNLNQSIKKVANSKDDGYKRLISDSAVSDDGADDTQSYDRSSCLCWVCKHKIIRKNWKIFLASVILTIIGLVLIIIGLALGSTNGFLSDPKSIVFIVGGILLLIPGGYHFVVMCLAAYNIQGFKFSKLPTVKL